MSRAPQVKPKPKPNSQNAPNAHHNLRPIKHDAFRMSEVRRRLGRELPGVPLARMTDEQILRAYHHRIEHWQAAEHAGKRRLRGADLGSASGEAAPAEPEEAPMRENTKTFLAIEAVNPRGEAVPDLKFKVKLSDGSTRDGKLDDKGCARLTGIPEGTCDLSFPDLNEGDWALG